MYIVFEGDEQVATAPTIEEAVSMADAAAQASPRSAGVGFYVIQAGGPQAYSTRSCGPEEAPVGPVI